MCVDGAEPHAKITDPTVGETSLCADGMRDAAIDRSALRSHVSATGIRLRRVSRECHFMHVAARHDGALTEPYHPKIWKLSMHTPHGCYQEL